MRYICLTIACIVALGLIGCSKSQPKPAGAQVTQTTKPGAQEQIPTLDKNPKADHPEYTEIIGDRLGVPIYPGSKPEDSLSTGTSGQGTTEMMASFTTTDSFDQVMIFYRKKLKGYTESPSKIIKGSTMAGFRRTVGGDTDLILIEKPAKGPIRISVAVSRAGKS